MELRKLKTLQQGVTLVEILIVVMIIGILIMVVYPSYLEHVRKTKRLDAKKALIELAQLQEDNFITTKQYLKDNEAITSIYGNNYDLGNYGNGNYTLVLITNATASEFTLRATAIDNQAEDTDCAWFEINSIGNRTAGDENNVLQDDCW